jgi:signal transduction histidine kinase
MSAKVTEAMRTAMAAPPQHPATGTRSAAHDKAREAAFAAMSRELRLCLDDEGCLMHADGPWRETLGVEPYQLLGAHWTSVVAEVDHTAMRIAIERVLAHDDPRPETELRMEATAGATRLVRWRLTAGSGGDMIAAVGYERTEEHLAAAEARGDAARLQRRVKELEALVADLGEHSRSMESFAATAAHQLSEPLIVAESGTIMVAEELGDDLDPDLRARLDAIGRGAARARQTVDALLMDARSAKGIGLQAVDTGRVVAQVLEELGHRLSERGITADVGALPTVRAEPRLLAVVYQNLISNALKYGPRDGGSVRIVAERHEEDWKLIVANGGAPLPEDEAQRIFEPWRRVPGERRAPGSGLGLAICARLIERVGGTIGVEPLTDGNAFYFILPAA